MARYVFSSDWNGKTMAAVRQEITSVAMAKPLDGTTPINADSSSTVYLVAIAANGTTYTIPSTTYVKTTGAVSTSDLTVDGNLTITGSTSGGVATFTEINTSTLKVNGSAYVPFIASNTAPSATDRLWIDTTTTVPILKYYNGSAWTSVGAVFG